MTLDRALALGIAFERLGLRHDLVQAALDSAVQGVGRVVDGQLVGLAVQVAFLLERL